MIDLEELDLYVEKGLISRAKHPTAELFIYNYTNKTQYERVWDNITKQCRGLILDAKGNIVARPFPKFFNLEEHSPSDIVFSKPFKVYEKLDGSLGILFKNPDTRDWEIATKGSFVSDQANMANKIYKENYAKVFTPLEGTTPLFEIIYPDNKVVVDYGEISDLILLGVIDNKTGKDIPEAFWPGPRVKHFVIGADIPEPTGVLDYLKIPNDGSNEGVVLVFDWPQDGPKTRVKLKLQEYVRLHTLIFGVSSKLIWEILKAGDSIDAYLGRLPDEIYSWTQEVVADLSMTYRWQEARIQDSYEMAILKYAPIQLTYSEAIEYTRKNRKGFAELIAKHQYKNFLFLLLDGKSITEKVWDLVKPKYFTPFKQTDESNDQ